MNMSKEEQNRIHKEYPLEGDYEVNWNYGKNKRFNFLSSAVDYFIELGNQPKAIWLTKSTSELSLVHCEMKK